MCSNIILAVFMIGIIGGAGLCIVGLATPGWFKVVENDGKVHWDNVFSCFKNDPNNNYCKQLWDVSSTWMKSTIALTIVGILACVAALAWSIVVCFMCCCKSCLGPPLPILAFVAFGCQLAACVIYGVKVQTVNFDSAIKHPVDELGWSFILVIIGTVVYFIDIILGGLVVMFGAF